MRHDLVYRDEILKEITKEYNRKESWKTGGLQLAWIEKAVNTPKAVTPEAPVPVSCAWHTTDLPPQGVYVVCEVSAQLGGITYDHALAVGEYYEKDGWCFCDNMDLRDNEKYVTVHKWCDVQPEEE